MYDNSKGQIQMTTRKESSYQKLKRESEAEISSLRADIAALVKEDCPTKAVMVRMKWAVSLQMEKAIWAGDATHNTHAIHETWEDKFYQTFK